VEGAGATLAGAGSEPLVVTRFLTEEIFMRPSSKGKVAGKIHEVKGAVKEKVGRLTNNPDLKAEGKVEKVGGKVQEKIGQVRKVLGQ
jgi:uncharacterized protein YjbJ (UPF0337 family)